MLLSSVNERYNYLHKTYQHADVKLSLEKIFAIMRDDDAEFQKTQKSTPIGSVAFLNAVEIHAELLYTQRHGGQRPGNSRLANPR